MDFSLKRLHIYISVNISSLCCSAILRIDLMVIRRFRSEEITVSNANIQIFNCCYLLGIIFMYVSVHKSKKKRKIKEDQITMKKIDQLDNV